MTQPATPVPAGEEPPVVARLVIEVRSDGSTTIARGALEDRSTGQQVAIEARAGTPEELTVKLVKALLSTPLLGASAFRAAVSSRIKAGARRIRGMLPGGEAGPPGSSPRSR